MRNKIIVLAAFLFLCNLFFTGRAFAEYEVVCREVNSLFIWGGKPTNEKGQYELHFTVNEENNSITRTKVINLKTNEISEDNSQYKIFHNQVELLGYEYLGIRNPSGFIGFVLKILDRNPKRIEQKIIKAVGQVGIIDGYEILVIGEDFVGQSKSTLDYFVVVYSKRYKEK